MPRPHPPEFRRRAVELARSDKFLDLVSVQTTPLGGLQVFYGAPQGNGTKRARSALAPHDRVELVQQRPELDPRRPQPLQEPLDLRLVLGELAVVTDEPGHTVRRRRCADCVRFRAHVLRPPDGSRCINW